MSVASEILNMMSRSSGGSGGGDGYVTNGLVAHFINQNNTSEPTFSFNPSIPLSSAELTIELHYRADSAAQDSFCGVQFGSNNPYLVMNFNKDSSVLGENSDYALGPFIVYSGGYTTDFVSLPDLKWGTQHTYTCIMENNTLGCYFDGVKTSLERTGLNYSFTGNSIRLMNRLNLSRKTNGKWFDLRAYNRTLSGQEILQNYNNDKINYGN